MEDIAVILAIVLILFGAGIYVFNGKKKGRKCIGCPESCSGSCGNCSCNCGRK